MSDKSNPITNDFIARCTAVVSAEMADEQFGVSELADRMHMSRSNLLRRIKQRTNRSASQFIRDVRLGRAMELLESGGNTVSEVAFQVGFGGTSYFIKCFREHYGYPPGEVGKRKASGEATLPPPVRKPGGGTWLRAAAALTMVIAVGLGIYIARNPAPSAPMEKSIAVLPFKNDSNDSTNRYLINGLMEATLNNLQQIRDLRVVSRTSAEKYRNTSKTIPEVADELRVNYVVEGSGQKVGNRILLNIQLIDAQRDSHLWARQYTREVT